MHSATFRLRALSFLALLAIAGLACIIPSPLTTPTVPAIGASETPIQPPSPAATGERGTPDEARAMLQTAVEHYNSVGRTQALTDFTAGVAPFIDRDLYVFCLGFDGTVTANGGFPEYVGTPVDSLRDAEGNPLGQTMLDTASSEEVTFVEYVMINPVSGEYEPKIAFIIRLSDDVCGVGAYNPP